MSQIAAPKEKEMWEAVIPGIIQAKAALSWAWWCTSLVSATWEMEVGGSQVQGQPWQKEARPYLKNKLPEG
jgi:hypothetical protein